eukprot:m.116135 g.116135  ORF g.116135 m.116135 type:complete len:129 (-) comp13595_c0_seq1:1675-2061(-)
MLHVRDLFVFLLLCKTILVIFWTKHVCAEGVFACKIINVFVQLKHVLLRVQAYQTRTSLCQAKRVLAKTRPPPLFVMRLCVFVCVCGLSRCLLLVVALAASGGNTVMGGSFSTHSCVFVHKQEKPTNR